MLLSVQPNRHDTVGVSAQSSRLIRSGKCLKLVILERTEEREEEDRTVEIERQNFSTLS